MMPKKCPHQGCRRTRPHDHIADERSTERERVLTYIVKIPFYGSDDKADANHLSVARALALSVNSVTMSAVAEIWDEQEMPENEEIYVLSTPFAFYGHDTLEDVE